MLNGQLGGLLQREYSLDLQISFCNILILHVNLHYKNCSHPTNITSLQVLLPIWGELMISVTFGPNILIEHNLNLRKNFNLHVLSDVKDYFAKL